MRAVRSARGRPPAGQRRTARRRSGAPGGRAVALDDMREAGAHRRSRPGAGDAAATERNPASGRRHEAGDGAQPTVICRRLRARRATTRPLPASVAPDSRPRPPGVRCAREHVASAAVVGAATTSATSRADSGRSAGSSSSTAVAPFRCDVEDPDRHGARPATRRYRPAAMVEMSVPSRRISSAASPAAGSSSRRNDGRSTRARAISRKRSSLCCSRSAADLGQRLETHRLQRPRRRSASRARRGAGAAGRAGLRRSCRAPRWSHPS